MLEGMMGVVIFVISFVLMFVVVPWKRVMEFLGFGLVAGLGVALMTVGVMQNVLGYWIFYNVDILYAYDIPLFLSAAWTPLTILFSHLMSTYRDIRAGALTLVAFALGASLTHLLLIEQGMLFFHNWNLPLTFLLSLGIHSAITLYLYEVGLLEDLKESWERA